MDAVIIPRLDLRYDELIRLGESITAFLTETGSQESSWMRAFGASSLNDLLAGEPPKPLGLTMLSIYREFKRKFGESMTPMASYDMPDWVRERFHPFDPETRAVFLELSSTFGSDREAAMRNIRDRVPEHLLDHVKVVLSSFDERL